MEKLTQTQHDRLLETILEFAPSYRDKEDFCVLIKMPATNNKQTSI